ncbi:MAG: NAD(P)H-dependent oxidoreductase [Myxococcota bacterium]
MARVLVLFAHPAFERSRVNRALALEIADRPWLTFRDLYQVYPDFDIDPGAEQALLEAHDVVVFQHPFYWYSVPPLLKQWQDLVLQHGWAYGHEGHALEGKAAMHALTAGGGREAYAAEGKNHFTIDELLRPCEQTARLCRMRWLPPFVVYGTHRLGAEGVKAEARRYRTRLEALRDDRTLEVVRAPAEQERGA